MGKEEPMELAALFVTLADAADGWGHHDWDGGWWIVMAAGMVLFWGLVIAGIVWIVKSGLGDRGPGRGHGSTSAMEILDRRFAEGAIDADEYRERRQALRDSS